MVLYATVIPFNSIESEKYDVSHETLKILINMIELILISYSLKVRNSFNEKESHLKVLSVGLAWALADAVTSYLLYFLMNATGEEFKWEYIQSAIQSNLDLIERISVVALVECYEKLKSQNALNIHILFILIAKYFFSGLGFRVIDRLRYDDPWNQLFAKGVFTFSFAFLTKLIFNNVFREETEDDVEEEALKEFEKLKKKKN